MKSRGSRVLPCAAAAALLLFPGSGAARAGQATQQADGPVAFGAVVRFVDEEGWRVDLGKLCAELDLSLPDGGCVFKQVSIQEMGDRGDPRGFNVPRHPNGIIPFVMIFHLGPLVGEFFIASAEGQLIKAFYRTKGAGYRPLPNSEAQDEFKADLAYWVANLSRVKQSIEAHRAQRPAGADRIR